MIMKSCPGLLVLLAAACTHDRPATKSPTASPASAANSSAEGGGRAHRMVELTAFVDPGAETFKRPVNEAIAVIYSMRGDRIGTSRFVERGYAGLDLFTSLEGLPPGEHAYHVHVFGDCSAPDASSAGPHFHFTGSSFDENVNIITGNLGELVPDDEGRAAHQTRLPFARLHGPFSLLGRAVVIHARGNDPTVTPAGDAGDRIGCGVIGVGNPAPETGPTARR